MFHALWLWVVNICSKKVNNILYYFIILSDAFKKTIEKFGKVNIVINNAGIMTKYITSWEQAIDTNYVCLIVYRIFVYNNI